jgi:hypothetical protein
MSFNSKYLANNIGNIYKIRDLGLKQTNSFISDRKRTMKRCLDELTALYERRSILLEQPIESGKSKRKVAEFLKLKAKSNQSSQRMQQIILLALTQLSEDEPDLGIVTAILEQARELDV